MNESCIRFGRSFYAVMGPWAAPRVQRLTYGWRVCLGWVAFGCLRIDVEHFVGVTADRLNAYAAAFEEVLDTLQDFVSASCQDPDGLLRSNANSTQAQGLRTLAAAGRVEIVQERGRCVVARWKDGGA